MFVLWGKDRTFLYNDAYIPVLGEHHPQAFGRPFFAVWPEVESAIAPVIDAAFAGKESFFEDLEVQLTRSGVPEPAWFTFAYSPIFDGDGSVRGALCVCMETTPSVLAQRNARAELARRQAVEQELRQLNETLEARVAEALAERRLLADIVEATDAFVQVIDLDFRWRAINRAAADEFERLFSVRPSLGMSMLDALKERPGDREYVKQLWSRALAGETFSERGEFGASSKRCYEMKFSVLLDASGARIGAYQFAYDVTERVIEQRRAREAEAAKRDADELHRAYFENAADALFVIGVTPDAGFVVEQLNPAHEASIGFKLSDVRGKRIESFLPEALLEPVRETYRHVVQTAQMLQYRQVFDFDGQPQHWDTSLVPVLDREGRVTRITGSSRNVTAQVTAEEALRQVQKMDALGQLTGGIAHDFNNLLGAVMGGFDLILRKPDDPERVRRMAANGLAAAERGARLTSQLLAFSRAQKIERKVVDVARVVDEMRELLQRTLGPQIILNCELQDVPTPVLSDKVQLEMAVLNLAINARDAMPDGGNLTIRTRVREIAGDPQLAAGPYVELSVSDTGEGMSEDVAARAFEPFYTTKSVGKGTGLGLSQVYSVARQGGGAARIASSPGHGSTVSILLPLSEAVPDSIATGVTALESPATGAATVLVIDDDPDIRRMLTESLDTIGYRVVEAPDGAAGLDAIERVEPDLVLVDFAMPGMDGAEVARAIRKKRPKLPIVIASGFSDTAAIENVGGSPLPMLRKPFRLDELQEVVVTSLNRARQA